MATVSTTPPGYHSVTPYLMVADVPQLVDFLKETFDAKEIERHERPDGSVGHAEVRIADSVVMMGGARAEWPAMHSALYVYVADVDATYSRALGAGATSISEPSLQYYGDRMCGVKDPAGNTWWIATHVEDVSAEEMARRARAERR